MSFDVYDLFSKLVPGGILTIILVGCGWLIIPEKIPDSAYLFIAYFIGHVIDALAYELRRLIWWLFGGLPAIQILDGKPFPDHTYPHIQELNIHFGLEKTGNLEKSRMFDSMYQQDKAIEKTRIKGFNDQWIGARNLWLAFMVGLTPMIEEIFQNHLSAGKSWGLVVVTLTLAFMLFRRAKNRQFFFVREVLDTFYYNFVKKKTVPA